MTGYGFYKIYMPIRLHFTSSYDVIKFSGKSKAINRKSFENRKDSNLFEYWGHKFDDQKAVGQLCISNFVYNDVKWMYQQFAQADDVLSQWKLKILNLTKGIQCDYNVLSGFMEEEKVKAFSDFFIPTRSGKKPPLLQLLLSGTVSREFVAVVDFFVSPCLSDWETLYEVDPLISDYIFNIKKYASFIIPKVSDATVRSIFKEAQFQK